MPITSGVATTQMGLPNSTPITGGTPIGPSAPQFSDIQKLLTPQTNAQGISPEASNVMNLINQQRDYYAHLGESAAQARATQFGNAGSSIEQFGIASADQATNQAALGAQSNVLTADMANQLALKQQLGTLTSDEIASLRNMGLSQQALQLQQSLGQQGINLGYQNLSNAAKLGQQQGTNQLIGSLAPLLFGGGGFGGFGGGNGNSLIGGSGGMAGGGLLGNFGGNISGAFGGSGGLPGLQGGAPLIGGQQFGALGGGAGLGANLGLGAGGMLLGQQAFGNNSYGNAGAVAGGIGGSLFGPIGSGVGSFLGSGVGNLIGNQSPSTRLALATGGLSLAAPAIGKALGLSGGSGQSSQQSGQINGQQAGNVDTDTLATTLGKNPGQITYNSNAKGSFEAAYNSQLNRLSPDQLVTRYSTLTNPNYFNTPQDQNQKKAYDAAVSMNNGQPITGSQYSWFLTNFGSKYGLS